MQDGWFRELYQFDNKLLFFFLRKKKQGILAFQAKHKYFLSVKSKVIHAGALH